MAGGSDQPPRDACCPDPAWRLARVVLHSTHACAVAFRTLERRTRRLRGVRSALGCRAYFLRAGTPAAHDACPVNRSGITRIAPALRRTAPGPPHRARPEELPPAGCPPR